MSTAAKHKIDDLYFEIQLLDPESQQELFNRIEKIKTRKQTRKAEKTAEQKPKFKLTDLRGSMRGVYTDPNADDETRRKQIDDFIRRERESWDQ